MVTMNTAGFWVKVPTFCPHSVFMCFVWIWEQTAIISLYSINWQVCITETECVYCAVRTGPLPIIQDPLGLILHTRYDLVITFSRNLAFKVPTARRLSLSVLAVPTQNTPHTARYYLVSANHKPLSASAASSYRVEKRNGCAKTA